MTIHKKVLLGALTLVVLSLGIAAFALASNEASAGGSGILDDGADLLPQATLTLQEAISAAQSAAEGPVDEVDLEYWQGKLVFNVDVSDQDVKVDATTGAVLATESDD